MSFIGATPKQRPRLEIQALVIPKCKHCGDSRVRNNRFIESENCPNCGKKCEPTEDYTAFDSEWDHGPLWGWFGLKRKIINFINTYNNPRRKKL